MKSSPESPGSWPFSGWLGELDNPAMAAERWRLAEEATGDVVRRIQPTSVSEQRRCAVVEHVQSLIRGHLGSEVFPFGSVPLKTYLPDGDVDLTALGVPNAEDTLAMDVYYVLETEEQNKDAEFEVKDVQYIRAEVKLVKCLVQNIVVDISFNQIGGLCTLCFLEQVDRFIGKDNLFKRSIILIKAWCYYESRILGAHHGLISTYALETLVLYIFNVFHSSLDGPLAVLYRFLDYYSKFDWDNYCVSLNGPVAVSSLPELVAQPPENEGGGLLLNPEFLKSCVDMFSVPSKVSENYSRVFLQKHLNIIDPLKENNNLGRSVSKGNFYRIRSAFSYGARNLGRILQLPSESIAEEINMFFMNTLDRHGSGERPDVQDSFPRCPCSTEFEHNGESKVEKGGEDKQQSGSLTIECHGVLCEEVKAIKISGSDKVLDTQLGNHHSNHHSASKCLHKCSKMETDGAKEANIVSGRCLAGDARVIATDQTMILRSVNETCAVSSSNGETCRSPSGKAYHMPHLFYHPENGRVIGNLDHTVKSSSQALVLHNSQLVQPDSYETESSSSSSYWLSSNHVFPSSSGLNDRSMTSSWSAHSSKNSHLGNISFARSEDNNTNGNPELLNSLDLSGDYENHFNNLLHAQWFQDCMYSGLFLPSHPSSPSHYHNKHSWDVFHKQSMFVHMNASGVVPGPPFSPPAIYPMRPPFISSAYATGHMLKPRGTGTYFPSTNYQAYRERQQHGRGRAPIATNEMPRPRNVSRPMTAPDNLMERDRHETRRQPPPPAYSGNGRGKRALLDANQTSHSAMSRVSHANGFVNSHEGKLEFGSLGSILYGSSSQELHGKSDPVSPHRRGSGQVILASPVHRKGTNSNSERMKQAYQLKDEDDFPPLTG